MARGGLIPGPHCTLARSRRILDAIDELSHLLLDDDSNKLQYESLLKKLKSLKNRMEDKSGESTSHFIEIYSCSYHEPLSGICQSMNCIKLKSL